MGLEVKLEQDEAATKVEPAAAEEVDPRSKFRRESAVLSDNILRIINRGNWESLQPNTGRSVEVGGHQVCVSYDVDASADYRTWEWQGHILLYDYKEQMYVPEYVYGNYFEPLLQADSPYENFLHRPPYGLTGIINSIERGWNNRTE